jgi:hypothetical protein
MLTWQTIWVLPFLCMACRAAKETDVDNLVETRVETGHMPLQVAAIHGTEEMCHQIWWPDKNSEISAQVFFLFAISLGGPLWGGDHERETTELLVLETGGLFFFTMSLLRSMHPSW